MASKHCAVFDESSLGEIRFCGCGHVSVTLGPVTVKMSRQGFLDFAQKLEAAAESAKTNFRVRCMTAPSTLN